MRHPEGSKLLLIIIRLMLHFSFVFGFIICSRGSFHWGLAMCVRQATWIREDAGSFGWKGRWRMTLLWSLYSAVAGPLYAFARVIALLKSVRISFPL